jgi:hypothetical protein
MERIRKFLGKDEEEEKPEEKVEAPEPEAPAEPAAEPESEPESEPEVEPEPEVEIEEAPADRKSTIPYHSEFTDRLKFLFNEPSISGSIEGPDEFSLEFMAMGERFNIIKEARGEIKFASGTAPDEDVFIRVSNDVVAELLSAATFDEFSKIYMKYYKGAEAGKFVKIELRKDISSMNRRGYARVPLLKLLVGQVR